MTNEGAEERGGALLLQLSKATGARLLHPFLLSFHPSVRLNRLRYDGAQLCAARHPLLDLLGARGIRGSLARAKGTQPWCDYYHVGHHRYLLLSFLAYSNPGPGQPPVWTPAEK